MAKLTQKQIKQSALAIIAERPGGIHFSELVKSILTQNPETTPKAIPAAIYDLQRKFPELVAKHSRGVYVPVGITTAGEPEGGTVVEETVRESDFYEPFAEWLKKDLDEVTDSAALGGAAMRERWGTPDVVGVYKPLASDLIKFPLEIVSAEIKINPQQPVVAFGQAVAYRLFSTKTYIAMPRTMAEEDLTRLEALCMLFGVGLVLFDLNPADPKFSIRVRAQRFSPDMFYVNVFAKRIMEMDAEQFEKLFR